MTKFSKLLILTLSLVTWITVIQAQTKFGNEWINPAKTYYKFKVAQDGMYRVTYEELVQAGLPAESIKGIDLKLFNYGKEHAIYVSDPNEFNAGDYIEFYGERNTIGLDSLLYEDWKTDLFNPEYSVVTDTNAYFLTVSPETNNLRYTQVNPDYNNNNLTPFPYYLHEEKVVYSGTFYKNVDGQIRFSNFEPTEGFGTGVQQTTNINLKTDKYVDDGPLPKVKFRLGFNKNKPRIDIYWNSIIKETKELDSGKTYEFSYDIDKTEINSSNILKITNTYSLNDKHRISYASVVYPRSFDFDNKSEYLFRIPRSTTKQFFEITNFKTDNNPSYLYDINKKIRYNTTETNNKVLAIVNASTDNDNKFILINSGTFRSLEKISVFKPKAFGNSDQEYIIISNKVLYSEGVDYVNEYAAYRNSQIGGGYKTEIVEIQDVYDHFGYGIDRHFMGIKQFASYMHTNWTSAKFVFMIGKGVEYNSVRTSNDYINNVNKSFFIPTFGFTGSDNLLFSEGNFTNPYFAIGRLAATTSDDIKNYLSKIKQHELAPTLPQTIEDKYWMKKILHLGGGSNASEQTNIKSNLLNLENIIKNNAYGGNIFSFFKTSSDPIQISTSEQLQQLINNGVSLITFFGHSGTGTFDFAIENPNKFTNNGKYHVVNSLGCYAGNIHSTGSSISESFVLEKDKGAVAFIASSGTAYVDPLFNYSKALYQYLGDVEKTYPLGMIVQLINEKNRLDFRNETVTLYQQLTYHGDPAIKLYKDNLPDYTFDESSIKTNENIITTNTESIDLTGRIVNLGTNIHQNITLKSELLLQDGTSFETRFDTFYMDKSEYFFKMTFNLAKEKSAGINKIVSVIDFENNIEEGPEPGAKQNNELSIFGKNGFEFFVSNNDVRPIYPKDYSIINKNNIELIAGNSDLFAKPNKYYFEFDTTATFDSPILQKKQIEQNFGGAIKWKPIINLTPNTVYYWRVAPEAEAGEGLQWRKSSFIYIPSSPEGWNQSHYYQKLENKYSNVELNNNTRTLQFVKNLSSAIITNGLFPDIHPEIKINADPFRYIRYDSPVLGGVYVSVFDPITGEFWKNKFPSLYGSTMNSPWAAEWGIFPYHTRTTDDRKLLINFLENIIPDGHIVTIFSIQRNDLTPQINYESDKWDDDENITGTTLFEVFEKQNILNLRSTITNRLPFILAYKKGDPNYQVTEEYAQSETEELRSVINVETFWTKGTVESTEIGPAKKWKELIWDQTNYVSIDDITSLNIYGIKETGIIDTLFTGIQTLNLDLSTVNADTYPKLKLEYLSSDTKSRTSANLSFWRVVYDGLPEIVMDPNTSFEFYKDTLNQGEEMKVKIGILNASETAIEPFLVDYTINQPNNNIVAQKDSIESIAPLTTRISQFAYNTAPYFGDHSILININNGNNIDELIKTNNISSKKFYVKKDNNSPLLDVTIDGIHIMDDDIISPKPQIDILVKDQSTFLLLNDINLIDLKLFSIGNQEIPIQQNELNFTTDQVSNTMKLIYTPSLVDGEYRLEVQAKDKSGNKSGVNPYSIRFKVITKNSVTQVLNYPNPFSTNTQFVFTLTGQEVPENFNISIYTLTGKLVKEITKNDLGTLRIGTNRTSYKWDGTDEYGSKLANGVYLYKVNINDKSGKEYEQMKTKIDDLFNQGFGKLVILR